MTDKPPSGGLSRRCRRSLRCEGGASNAAAIPTDPGKGNDECRFRVLDAKVPPTDRSYFGLDEIDKSLHALQGMGRPLITPYEGLSALERHQSSRQRPRKIVGAYTVITGDLIESPLIQVFVDAG